MAEFNNRTITVKIPNKFFDKERAKREADALEALLVSANPIRCDYDLTDDDFDMIAEERKKIETIISNLAYDLKKKKRKEGNVA